MNSKEARSAQVGHFSVGILRAAVWLLLGKTILRSKLTFCCWHCLWVLQGSEQQIEICLGLTVAHFFLETYPSPVNHEWTAQTCSSLEKWGRIRVEKDKDSGWLGKMSSPLVKVISERSKGVNCSKTDSQPTVKRDVHRKRPGYFRLQKPHWGVSEAICWDLLKPFYSECGLKPAALAPRGAHQKCRPPEPPNEKLHFNKIPRWFLCLWNFEIHFPKALFIQRNRKGWKHPAMAWVCSSRPSFSHGTWCDHRLTLNVIIAFC